jgi:hypothetical protein
VEIEEEMYSSRGERGEIEEQQQANGKRRQRW